MKGLTLIAFLSISSISLPSKACTTFQKTDTVPKAAQKLIQSYPGFITGFADNHLIFKDGNRMIWNDGVKNKTYQTLLDNPDLEDMFAQPYKAGTPKVSPAKSFDPGRIRNEAFFMKMYGASKQEVEGNLTTIIWCPKLIRQKIVVTRVNGVDKQLEAVSKELDEHPELKKYLGDIGGTFVWRNIAGTHRHSMHSFGMTIDINIKYSDYWQWTCKCTDENTSVVYQNRIPQVIVDIFEKHGFIWGGKWYHYDTMHFEYRPELLN
ncbi:M15 family metallopeptidase [Mucilaginibacter ginsenosidivorans]|uniref:M15 family metallopeptidase n=1 Tax=Mucilaginibacter ginsenosidivorans TaxID=398053 RepID=A0A5B8UV74_9SPHI|nr:M15 family metallopeptidase [Mucilaginibacter ginsenosidivorans]QEC62778.1 M15 family metallopeptidase [Mucilaginibacter ginsenosidivorans]